ncbi:protein KRTCAP2 homolog [Teleopsis dalmanni]|uniref:protein KRTCAP2 homolog n=1 Tax=Teleopsis dalmanni TaxID=139649 RepID=UPI0018CECF17|nr:protein KRTCAP2 homolog [Teleopsis dalmanni]
MATTGVLFKSSATSAGIACLFCAICFFALRLNIPWFRATQLNTIFGGYVGSWLFLMSLTAVSNIEMILFGADYQAKFIPEILFCITLATAASVMVHRVSATSCVLFSIITLYFVHGVSVKYYGKGLTTAEAISATKKGGNKKNK